MCSIKTMVKISLVLGLRAIVGYVLFPIRQDVIQRVAPFLLVLACPLAMYVGMKGMNGQEKQKTPHGEGQQQH